MANKGAAPIASMGADVPLACLSHKARSFFDYFMQRFAQVTNPPIDALRETFITSTTLYVGNHGNILEDSSNNCHLIKLSGPILTKESFNALANISKQGFSSCKLRAVYPYDTGSHALANSVDELCKRAKQAVQDGNNILIISDRCSQDEVPIPSLLAVSAVHNCLLKAGLRTKADIIIETGDAFSPHDFAALLGYSASGMYPYLVHETIYDLCKNDIIKIDPDKAIQNYNKAITAGIVSVMSKMGISTMQGYHSAQIFEAVGLSQNLIDKYFSGTISRIGGLDIDDVQRECGVRHNIMLQHAKSIAPDELPSSGMTFWRPNNAEEHIITPQVINLLQRSVREGDFDLFMQYSNAMHPQGRTIQLRDLLEFSWAKKPLPLDEVEPASEIVKRFKTGAMSYGSISREAHECLAIAMNRLGARSNTGEGGEDIARETTLENGDSKKSAIKQIASGRFGVTSRYLMSAKEIQIKLAQGAKPGEGGHLPGKKVWPWIASTRRSTPGVGLISPPPHHDIYSIEDLAELIFDMHNANPEAAISVKLVSETGVGTIATGVAKGGAHKILISGFNGGTGAAPRDSIYHAGLPLEIGLAETQQTLLQNGLRSRIMLEADGKMMDGRDVAIACLLGAEEFGFATAPLLALGCLMQRDCQQDTCPVGIATQNCHLRGHFSGKPEHVVNYMMFVAEQLRHIMARLGLRSVEEMVGHPEYLRRSSSEHNWKAQLIDIEPLLAKAQVEFGANIEGAAERHYLPEMAPENTLPSTLDASLFVPYTQNARKELKPLEFSVDIANTNRCVGTMLGSRVTQKHPDGLPDSTLCISCEGSGGMSFGAFIPSGIELSIKGDANDYFGKGLSGGILSVAPSADCTYKPEENISVGNVAFYGATSGKGFVNGLAGQRFAVRNSGASLVVEGCGNNGCEYMTGGEVLILGEVGLNFAAGMSGGIAYVYDRSGTLAKRYNSDMVNLQKPSSDEIKHIKSMIKEHVEHTNSPLGIMMLYRFKDIKKYFVKVIPKEYERALQLRKKAQEEGASYEQAVEQAFEMMRKDA